MKVSQAAIDEIRAVRLAKEAQERREKLAKLTRMADCCASCSHTLGYPDILCGEHEIGIKPHLICNDYERRSL